MDETQRHHNPNPISSANIFSRTFFWWMNPLLKTGYKRQLETEDMYNVAKEDASGCLGDELEIAWSKEIQAQLATGRKPKLMRALFRCYGIQYIALGILAFIEEGSKIVQPVLLAGLIRFFTPGSTISTTEAYLYALGVSLCSFVTAISLHPYMYHTTRLGMRMRVACCSLIYRKSLRLSNKALGQTTIGQIVNLISNDVNRFDDGVIFLHFLWLGPVQAIAVLVILWYEIGTAVLAGFAVLILIIPLQAWMGALFSKLRLKTAIHTDERVRVMNEIITGMRVIKMYCWEKPFGDLVEKIRRTQLKYSFRYLCVEGLREFLWVLGDKTLILTVIFPYLITTPYPRTRDVFLLLAFISPVQRLWMGVMVEACKQYGNCHVSVKRITKFLCLEEMGNIDRLEKQTKDTGSEDFHINISNVTAKWDKNIEQNTLEKISVSVKAGQLLAVIGPVGAGKSSLLMSILGELPTIEGNIDVRGKIAYVSQQPWVFSASFRQNVTMGAMFDSTLYERSIGSSALQKDISALPNADATLIGDRGVTLSGGQRARISLARALYTDADVYLLDDPLSAVDAAVGRHIFEKCIQGVLRKKPRILVTHQVQYLKEADQILILKDGIVHGSGTYEELSNSGIDFASLLEHKKDEEATAVEESTQNSTPDPSPKHNNIGSSLSLSSKTGDFVPDKGQIQEEEQRKEGTVGVKAYIEYFRAGSNIFTFTLLVLLNLLSQTAYVTGDWYISRWANEEENKYAVISQNRILLEEFNVTNISTIANVTVPVVHTNLNISIFLATVAGVFVFGFLRAIVFFKIAISASQNLHDLMFTKILRSPMSFFDNNPVGRVLNRFAKDVGSMDDLLPIAFFDFLQHLLLISGIIVVAGVINPWVFIPTVPLGGLFIIIRRYYLRSSRSIKRLEGTTRSPVFSHLSATLQGLHTIRAFNMEEKFVTEFDAHQDLHTEAWFLILSSNRWFGMRLDILCAVFVTAVTLCSVPASSSLDAGLVGLSITYAMVMMGSFQWGVRQSAEVENQMISVERVLEYTQLPSEAALDSDHKPPPTWPQDGIITGEKASLKYSETGPTVLKELSFDIKSQEKVGIVGRTGAGKSSLITMLFRLVEPTGKLMIDGVSILEIGLHDLRKTISIIPQDPVLFTGALRRNLDPFGHHDDCDLWKALEEVELKGAIEELPGQLETEVSEGGINFSVGQRQLICLARAILRKNKILLIDEATANVDPKTDELIQATIRDKFRHCTVLTIAHRLHTIMDSDRVLVLDDGKITDFDEPHVLLNKGEGHFYNMVQQTGKREAAHLADIALSAYRDRHHYTDIRDDFRKYRIKSIHKHDRNFKSDGVRKDTSEEGTSSSDINHEPMAKSEGGRDSIIGSSPKVSRNDENASLPIVTPEETMDVVEDDSVVVEDNTEDSNENTRPLTQRDLAVISEPTGSSKGMFTREETSSKPTEPIDVVEKDSVIGEDSIEDCDESTQRLFSHDVVIPEQASSSEAFSTKEKSTAEPTETIGAVDGDSVEDEDNIDVSDENSRLLTPRDSAVISEQAGSSEGLSKREEYTAKPTETTDVVEDDTVVEDNIYESDKSTHLLTPHNMSEKSAPTDSSDEDYKTPLIHGTDLISDPTNN